MKIGSSAFVVLTACFAAGAARAGEPAVPKSDQDKVSYSIGLNLGNNWKRQDLQVNDDWLLRGLRDAKTGGPTLLTDQEVREVLGKLQQELMAKRRLMLEQQRQLAEKTKPESAPTNAPAASTAPVLTSDIIKVPSREQMEKGEKIQTLKAEDLERLQKEQAAQPGKK